MRLSLLLSLCPLLFGAFSLSAATAATPALAPARLVHEFPKGTWIEGVAVRRCGSILLTDLTTPNLYLIDPLAPNPKPSLVYNFSEATSLLGITETTPDTFYVVASNLSLTTLQAAPGSNRLFRISFPPGRSGSPDISLAANIPDASLLNGLTTLNSHTVLAADSAKGVVWAIDTETGLSRIAIADPLMAPTGTTGTDQLGINGIRLQNRNTLFFTNSATLTFAKVKINPRDGCAAGKAEVISRAAKGTLYDDFALDSRGNAFVTTAGGNTVVKVDKKGKQSVLAGNLNSTELAGPTSAAFGRTRRDRSTLYVGTSGAQAFPVNGTVVVGGQLVAIDVSRF